MLGLWGATALVTSGMVGSGILILPKKMATFGSWSIFGWMLGAIMTYSIATIFGGLSLNAKNKNANSPIDFIADVFGEDLGFIIAFGYFVAIGISGALTALTIAEYFLPLVSWGDSSILIAISSILILFTLNIVSFGSSGSLLTMLTIVKIAFFLLITFAGIPYFVDYKFNFGSVDSLFRSASTSMFAFLGIEFAALSTGSIKDPEKNVMLSTRLGLFFAFLVFLGVHCAVLFTIPDVSMTKTPVLDAGIMLFGESARWLIALVGVISCVTTLNGIIIVEANAIRTFAKKGWVFESLGSLTNQGFPWIGGIIISIFSICSIFLNINVNLPCFLVAVVYLFSTFVYISYKKFDLYAFFAIISSLLILYALDWTNFSLMVMLYIVAYFIRFIFKVLKEK